MPAIPAVRGTAEVPDLTAGSGIERVGFIGAGDVHDPVDDDRRGFDQRDVGHRKHPARRELRHVALRDLCQRRVAIASRIAVIRRPIFLRSNYAISIARLSKQNHMIVIGHQL